MGSISMLYGELLCIFSIHPSLRDLPLPQTDCRVPTQRGKPRRSNCKKRCTVLWTRLFILPISILLIGADNLRTNMNSTSLPNSSGFSVMRNVRLELDQLFFFVSNSNDCSQASTCQCLRLSSRNGPETALDRLKHATKSDFWSPAPKFEKSRLDFGKMRLTNRFLEQIQVSLELVAVRGKRVALIEVIL